jgi:hypothetical protein
MSLELNFPFSPVVVGKFLLGQKKDEKRFSNSTGSRICEEIKADDFCRYNETGKPLKN